MRLVAPALCLLAATPAEAQQPASGPANATAFFAKADTDKSGTLSLEEWLAAGRRDRGFQLLDTDKSGGMTPAELAEGMKKYGAMMPPAN